MRIVFLLTPCWWSPRPGTGAVYSIAACLSRGSSAGIMLWLRRTFAATYVLIAGRLAAESR